MSASQSVSKGDQPQWFGHPAGLATLFFTEMWERFSYYGMRAILILFMTSPIAIGGLGWAADKAGPLYGLYTALVYLTALPGGWIADRFIGQRRAVMTGAIIIMFGHISLMFHGLSAFYAGLFLIVVGTGFLKPNISALVGGLYKAGEEDAKRDAGFSIFYMGINLGAFASPLVCGFLAQDPAFQNFLTGHGMDPCQLMALGIRRRCRRNVPRYYSIRLECIQAGRYFSVSRCGAHGGLLRLHDLSQRWRRFHSGQRRRGSSLNSLSADGYFYCLRRSGDPRSLACRFHHRQFQDA